MMVVTLDLGFGTAEGHGQVGSLFTIPNATAHLTRKPSLGVSSNTSNMFPPVTLNFDLDLDLHTSLR